MDVLEAINNWIIVIKYNDKNRSTLLWIKSQVSSVLHPPPFEFWKAYHNFGPITLYDSNIYKPDHRISNTSPCRLSTKPHLLKNKHGCMTLYSQLTIMKFYWTNEYINSCHVKSYISYQINITYIHIIDYGFLFLHTRWMWCTVITGILNFNTCTSWSQDVVIWFFPSSLFTPRACLSQIHSHVPSCTVISTSIIFVSIATFTNMGEC